MGLVIEATRSAFDDYGEIALPGPCKEKIIARQQAFPTVRVKHSDEARIHFDDDQSVLFSNTVNGSEINIDDWIVAIAQNQ